MKKILKKNKLLLYCIIILATVLRFINYWNRWGLASDHARDLIVSIYALNNHLIPLIGPFSSAGQFVYGPQWYWIISLFVFLSPNLLIGPWIMQTILYVFAVYIMFLIGKEIINEKFGLIMAFLTAISTQQIMHSTNLVSPSMAGFFAIISVYFFIRSVKYSKGFDLFLLGFFIANAVNIHFQAIGLLFLIPVGFLFSKRKLKQLVFLILGFLIPFIPLLIFDLKTNFFESRNMLDYYLYGQNRIYVPNRWLTYVGIFWPKTWSEVIGGHVIISYLLIALLVMISLYEIIKRKISKEMLSLIISFLLIFVMLRYYKGIIFGVYTAFLSSFLLIFSSFVLYKLNQLNKFVFWVFLLIITVFTMRINISVITSATNNTAKEANLFTNKLIEKLPNEKFSVYLYEYQYSERGLPLVLFLDTVKRIDDSGKKIGLAVISSNDKVIRKYPKLISNIGGIEVFDLTNASTSALINENWVSINPSAVYESTEEWYLNEKNN